MDRYVRYVPFSVTASGAVDLAEILVGTGKRAVLRLVTAGTTGTADYGDAEAEGLELTVKRGVGHTAGSGGAAISVGEKATTDPATTLTGKTGNTSPATAGGGTLAVLHREAFNAQAGVVYQPPPELCPEFAAGESIIIGLSAPADAAPVSGVAVVEEMG